MLLALNYMHQLKPKGIMHRDLKLENILIQRTDDGSTFDIKLTDFGYSTFTQHDEKPILFLGSAPYMSPELLVNKPHDRRVDIWAVGVLSYVLGRKKFPFDGQRPEEVIENMKEIKF